MRTTLMVGCPDVKGAGGAQRQGGKRGAARDLGPHGAYLNFVSSNPRPNLTLIHRQSQGRPARGCLEYMTTKWAT